MRVKVIAIFIVFLLMNTSFAYADFDPIQSIEEGLEKTGEALSTFEATDIIINVDSYHPPVLSEQAFESDQPSGYPITVTLTGIKTNPLMDLQKIDSMRVRASRESLEYLRGHPQYKRPQRGYFDLDNMGYLILRLKELKEDEVPRQLDINMTADITFEIQNGFGVNEQDLILPILSEEEFSSRKSEFNFWNGRGYVRLANIRDNYADLVVYDGRANKYSFPVKEGEPSGKKSLSGGVPYLFEDDEAFIGRNYRNTYRVKVNQISGNKDKAKVEMILNGEYKLKEFVEGQSLYEGSRWKVNDVKITDSYDEVEFVNEETKDKLVLRGGKFYVPSKKEEKAAARFKFTESVSYGDYIIKYGGEYAALVAAVIEKESSFISNSIGDDGEVGLMQLMPDTAYGLGMRPIYDIDNFKKNKKKKDFLKEYIDDLEEIRDGDKSLDIRFDPEKNIEFGVKYLKQKLVEFKGDEGLAVSAYNMGAANVKKACGDKSYDECGSKLANYINYVEKVLDYKKNYEGMLQTVYEKVPDVDSDDEEDEIDSELNRKYREIKLKLDNLFEGNFKNKEEINDVLNDYGDFLDEVNEVDKSESSKKYKKFMFDDLFELGNYYQDPNFVSEDREDILEGITTLFRRVYSSFVKEGIVREEVDYVEESSDYYFEKAVESYRKVIEESPGANYKDRDILMDAQEKIAEIYDHNLKQYEKAIEEYRILISYNYPEREAVEERIKFLEMRTSYFSDNKNIFEDGNAISLTLYGTVEADEKNEVRINVNGKSEIYSLKPGRNRLEKTGWYLKEINLNNVLIGKEDRYGSEDTEVLRLGREEPVRGLFILEDVKITQEAHITILPGEERITTQSTFMLHIPVEPRLWDFTPEQIENHINASKKTVDYLNKAITAIEKVYKWWSLSCYGTFFWLTAKNLFWFGAKGKNIARKNVMSAWKTECETKVSNGNFDTVFDCVEGSKKEINYDLDGVSNILNNKELSEGDRLERLAKLELESLSLREEYDIDYLNYKFDEERKKSINNIEQRKGESQKDFNKRVDEKLSEEYKDFFKNLKDSEYTNLVAPALFEKVKDSYKNKYAPEATIIVDKSVPEVEGMKVPLSSIMNRKYSPTGFEGYPLYKKEEEEIEGKKIEEYTLLDKDILAPNDKKNYYYFGEDNKFHSIVVSNDVEGTKISHMPRVSLNDKGRIDKLSVDHRTYLRVSRRGSDGMPLEVELWGRYSQFGSQDNLPLNTKSAGRIRGPFSLDDCLEGSTSGREGVDILGSLKTDYPGLKEACAELVRYDRQVGLMDKESGEKLGGKYFIEHAIQETGGLECFDIMGIDDCLTLFSMCDPVMCPISRFNAGGKWEVPNVVSTGVFGSIFLGIGLWDFKRIPPEMGICIPGIDAGLKNYRSLAEGYQECLIARRDKGENIGICDTIRSVGYCKIFWREGTALLGLTGGALDNLLGFFNKPQGGGEYAFFQSNMERGKEFLNFFTNEYATTYFSAYRGASTNEIGEKLCEAAIYGKVPGVGGFIDQLTKPEGPVQFTGWFTEVPNSDVGGNLYSDYEVYYHIYAGEDREQIKYVVYLKDLDDLARRLWITRTTGYLNRGDFVDETVRRQELTGYDELCIMIENQEHCGFGRVSSDLLVDYIGDKALEDQLTEKVTNERECIGESTVFTNPGVGELVDAMYPNLLRNGIVRVCSDKDPGKGVKGSAWRKVGTCGDNNLGQSLGDCWLSKQSYVDALSKYDIERRKEAEKFFEELGLDLRGYEEVVAIIERLIGEIKDILSLSKDKSEIIKDISGKINEFIKLDEETIDLNLNGKINYEIGEAYYGLAVYLNKKEVEEEPDVEKGDTVSKEGVEEGIEKGFGCCNTEQDIYLGVEILKTETFCSQDAKECSGFKWVDGGRCVDNKCVIVKDTTSLCEFEYADGGLSSNVFLKYKLGDKKWHWKLRGGSYDPIKSSHLWLVVGIYDDILKSFLKQTPDYEEGIKILLEYVDDNKDTLFRDKLLVHRSDSQKYGAEGKVSVSEELSKINKFCSFKESQKEISKSIKYSLNIQGSNGPAGVGVVVGNGKTIKITSGETKEIDLTIAKVKVLTSEGERVSEVSICGDGEIEPEEVPKSCVLLDKTEGIPSKPFIDVEDLPLEFMKNGDASYEIYEVNIPLSPKYTFPVEDAESEMLEDIEIPYAPSVEFIIPTPPQQQEFGILEVMEIIPGKPFIEPLYPELGMLEDIEIPYTPSVEFTILPAPKPKEYQIEIITASNEIEEGESSVDVERIKLFITDAEGEPLKDTEVIIDDKSLETDDRGIVELKETEEKSCFSYNNEKSIQGKLFSCYPGSECRSNYIKGSLDCGENEVCCRPTCESAFGDYECVDTNVNNCDSEIKRFYCPGSSNVVCCKKEEENLKYIPSNFLSESFLVNRDKALCDKYTCDFYKDSCLWWDCESQECTTSFNVNKILIDYGEEQIIACGKNDRRVSLMAYGEDSLPVGTVMKIKNWVGGYNEDCSFKPGATTMKYEDTRIPWGREPVYFKYINPKTGKPFKLPEIKSNKKYTNPYGPAYANLVTAKRQEVEGVEYSEGVSLSKQLHGTGGYVREYDSEVGISIIRRVIPLTDITLYERHNRKFTHGCLRSSNRFILWLREHASPGILVYYLNSKEGDSVNCDSYSSTL